MTDLRKLTRIILLGIVIFFVLDIGLGVVRSCSYLFSVPSTAQPIWIAAVVSLVLMILFAGLILYVAKYKIDSMVKMVLGAEETSNVKFFWLPAAFRLLSVAGGFLCLFKFITAVSSSVLFTMYSAHKNMHVTFYPRAVSEAVGAGLVLVLGIYLVCGAPHFVRWQVKKTLEQCRELEAFEKKTS